MADNFHPPQVVSCFRCTVMSIFTRLIEAGELQETNCVFRAATISEYGAAHLIRRQALWSHNVPSY